MNGTITRTGGRSVQLAVMTTPSTSVLEAVAEARRRQEADEASGPETGRTTLVARVAAA